MKQKRENEAIAQTDAGETYFRHRGGKCRKAQGVLMQGDGASSIDRAEALEISTKTPVPQESS